MVYTPRRTVPSFGEETTYGTQASSLGIYMNKINPITIGKKNNLIKMEGLRDDIEVESYEQGLSEIRYDIPFSAIYTWRFLKYVFGQDSEVEAAGVYTHTITPLNNVYHPSITAELKQNDTTVDVIRALGSVVDECNVSWSKGDLVKATLKMIAQDLIPDTSAVGTASEPAGATFFKWNQVKVSINGTVITNDTGNFNIKKNTIAEGKVTDGSGSNKIARPFVGEFAYTFGITRDKSDRTFHALINSSGTNTIVVEFIRDASDDYAKFTFTGAKIATERTEEIDLGNNVIMERLAFDPTNCSVEVKNDETWA